MFAAQLLAGETAIVTGGHWLNRGFGFLGLNR